jgi:AhpD family alkylhydroperoxidase
MTDREAGDPIDLSSLKAAIMAEGVIDARTKKLLAIASAVALDCEPCVKRHREFAREAGISEDEVDEAVLVASLIRFGSGLKYLS